MSEYKVGDVVALRATIVKPPKHAQTEADTVWLESQTDRLEAVPAEAAEIRPWPDAERMALLEATLGEIVDALDYDLSEVRMVDPAIEIPEREARLGQAIRTARSLLRAGETAPKP